MIQTDDVISAKVDEAFASSTTMRALSRRLDANVDDGDDNDRSTRTRIYIRIIDGWWYVAVAQYLITILYHAIQIVCLPSMSEATRTLIAGGLALTTTTAFLWMRLRTRNSIRT